MNHQQIIDRLAEIEAERAAFFNDLERKEKEMRADEVGKCQSACAAIGHIFKPIKQGFFDSEMKACIVCGIAKKA